VPCSLREGLNIMVSNIASGSIRLLVLGALLFSLRDTCAWGAYHKSLRLCDHMVYPWMLAVGGPFFLHIGVFVAGAAQCILGLVPQSALPVQCKAALHNMACCSVCVRPYVVFSKAFGGRCAFCVHAVACNTTLWTNFMLKMLCLCSASVQMWESVKSSERLHSQLV
jgi:hypothetical protein